MREIEFRGKSTKDGTWVYGSYESFMQVLTDREIATIHVKMDWGLNSHVEVWDDTVGQYTGITDKNGIRIYGGDIVKFVDLELAMKPTGVVCFDNAKFFIKDLEFSDGTYHIVDFYDYNIPNRDFEVIGNIHDNPELLDKDQSNEEE